jgi:hypothetical protein
MPFKIKKICPTQLTLCVRRICNQLSKMADGKGIHGGGGCYGAKIIIIIIKTCPSHHRSGLSSAAIFSGKCSLTSSGQSSFNRSHSADM